MRIRSIVSGALLLGAFAACDSAGSSADAASTDAASADAGTSSAWPDLRFKGVGAFPEYTAMFSRNVTFALGAGGIEIVYTPPNRFGFTPLQLDASSASAGGNYSWNVVDFVPTVASEPLRAQAHAGVIDDFDDDVQELIAEEMVIASIDLKPEAYALVALGTASGPPSYDLAGHAKLARVDLDGWVAREGEAGRVVTALGTRADRFEVISYARHGDTRTFETRVVDTTLTGLEAHAGELSSAGYTITAFGQSGVDAFVMVGTRARGQLAPRELFTETAPQGPDFSAAITTHGLAEGYAIVGLVYAPSGSKVIGQR